MHVAIAMGEKRTESVLLMLITDADADADTDAE